MIETQVRNKERIINQKKQERLIVKHGTPTVKDLIEGVPQIWNIPNHGLFNVLSYNSKLYYSEWLPEE